MEIKDIIALLFTIIILPVSGWIILQIFQQNKQIATLQSGQQSIINTLSDYKDDITGVKSDLGRIEGKINLFLKTEIDTIKDISRESTEAIKKLASKL